MSQQQRLYFLPLPPRCRRPWSPRGPSNPQRVRRPWGGEPVGVLEQAEDDLGRGPVGPALVAGHGRLVSCAWRSCAAARRCFSHLAFAKARCRRPTRGSIRGRRARRRIRTAAAAAAAAASPSPRPPPAAAPAPAVAQRQRQASTVGLGPASLSSARAGAAPTIGSAPDHRRQKLGPDHRHFAGEDHRNWGLGLRPPRRPRESALLKVRTVDTYLRCGRPPRVTVVRRRASASQIN